MNIAYTMANHPGHTDLLLFDVAQELTKRGLKICGTVQINTERAVGRCDMDVQILPSGQVIRISQELGEGSRGCRLDPEALELAVGQVEATLRSGADVLIVNKFGKHEAGGRGFRNAIAEALSQDIPVIVGINELNKAAFEEFTAGTAVELAPDLAELVTWVTRAKPAALCVA